jgi:membrane protease YdiL (CAAX protease family)
LWVVLTVWNGFGEETGWRGFAVPRLAQRYGPLPGTLLVALAWAGWHVPMFFLLDTYRSLGLAILPGFVFGLAAGAVLLTWLYHRTGGSILAVAVWHGTFNLSTATQASQGRRRAREHGGDDVGYCTRRDGSPCAPARRSFRHRKR